MKIGTTLDIDEKEYSPPWLCRLFVALLALGTLLILVARGLPAGSSWIGGGLVVLAYLGSLLLAFRKKNRGNDAPYVVGLLLGTIFGGVLAIAFAILWGLGCLAWALWRGLDAQVFIAGLRFPLALGLLVAVTMASSFTLRPPVRKTPEEDDGNPAPPPDTEH